MVPEGMLKTFGSVVLYLPLIHTLFSIKIAVDTCWLSPEKNLKKYSFRVSYCYIDLVELQGSLNISEVDLFKLFHLHFSRCTIYNSCEKNPIHQKSFRPSSFYT